jgi:hypothetical protein
MNTYNVDEAIQAQKEYCKEWAEKHPNDWASEFMKDGKGFAPINGRCYCCNKNGYPRIGMTLWADYVELSQGNKKTEE